MQRLIVKNRLQILASLEYPASVNQTEPFGTFLKRLRERAGLTLRQVELATNGALSNAYLSQLESGKRPPPKPAVLVALAKAYGTSPDTLFERAGYSPAPTPSAIDVAYEQVIADRTFQFGTRFPGELNDDAKRIIIELYQQATGKRLLL